MSKTYTMYQMNDTTWTTTVDGIEIGNHDTRKQSEAYLKSLGAAEYFYETTTKIGDERDTLIDMFA